ncbi:tetraacyldisaccharide 4'-kinase [Ulvibacter litoralis]|uniref:Tetraacyldisaccharide 4'-kinase n=1 Tax=Ulvibacter litoralis TaxID=227084 RepID=A0A1G7GK12_9FLAO|nr:tetraacyldisaccharide 4'-kinase [Ulvibacter litoralis]GHC55879.1 tetraacyldisaccharide 4'-kinase [Ulvibacter litoralis]SDE88477.1 tetraacyldisaccharide 4'-kinase [Ulvibacter litoralis]
MNLLRKILFPFSLIYGVITAVRNYFYDKGWWESRTYDTPIICVGNLSTGGTGKSPMIEFLIDFLRKDFRIAVLSRGYKRKTTGFREVLVTSTAEEVGDEPLQFKQNFSDTTIAVCADRRTGIEQLEAKADVILLDDAFQHRKVKASTYILLTPFNDLYSNDYVLPMGNLREFRSGAQRADIVLVTKCPEGVSYAKMQEIEKSLQLTTNQKVYFSKIGYDDFIFGPSETLPLQYLQNKKFTLVTGIANPKPLIHFLKRNEFQFTHDKFPDHHHFSASEIAKLKKNEIILTTEKDYMRLQPKLGKFAIYYLPIKTIILREQEEFLKKTILEKIDEARFS